MKVQTDVMYTLSDKELKNLIRQYMIDELGTEVNIKSENIEFFPCYQNEDVQDVSAQITIAGKETRHKSKNILDF